MFKGTDTNMYSIVTKKEKSFLNFYVFLSCRNVLRVVYMYNIVYFIIKMSALTSSVCNMN